MWKFINCSKPVNLKRTIDESDTTSTASKWKKYEEKRPPRKFNESWKVGRPWLVYSAETGTMTCSDCLGFFGTRGSIPCVNLKNVNTFVTGSSNLKISTIIDHEKSASHMKATSVMKAKQSTPTEVVSSQSGRALLALKEAERSRLNYLFKNAHAVAKQGRPITDYSWLCKLDKAKQIDIGSTYISEKAAVDFIFFIAGRERKKIVELVNGARFFSFIMDGSTDISGTEQESVYVRVSTNGRVEERFLGIGAPISSSSKDLYCFINSLFDNLGIQKGFYIANQVYHEQIYSR